MNKLTLLFCLVCLSGCYFSSPTHGIKTGIIVKVAEEGFLFPTNEAQLIRGGLSGGSGVNGQAFDFNIQDPKVLQDAIAALESGAEVEVEYERELIASMASRENHKDPTALRISVRVSKVVEQSLSTQ